MQGLKRRTGPPGDRTALVGMCGARPAAPQRREPQGCKSRLWTPPSRVQRSRSRGICAGIWVGLTCGLLAHVGRCLGWRRRRAGPSRTHAEVGQGALKKWPYKASYALSGLIRPPPRWTGRPACDLSRQEQILAVSTAWAAPAADERAPTTAPSSASRAELAAYGAPCTPRRSFVPPGAHHDGPS